eukprot:scaffold198301_cov16-Tisochrysis_lutea.AAC.1
MEKIRVPFPSASLDWPCQLAAGGGVGHACSSALRLVLLQPENNVLNSFLHNGYYVRFEHPSLGIEGKRAEVE